MLLADFTNFVHQKVYYLPPMKNLINSMLVVVVVAYNHQTVSYRSRSVSVHMSWTNHITIHHPTDRATKNKTHLLDSDSSFRIHAFVESIYTNKTLEKMNMLCLHNTTLEPLQSKCINCRICRMRGMKCTWKPIETKKLRKTRSVSNAKNFE